MRAHVRKPRRIDRPVCSSQLDGADEFMNRETDPARRAGGGENGSVECRIVSGQEPGASEPRSDGVPDVTKRGRFADVVPANTMDVGELEMGSAWPDQARDRVDHAPPFHYD